MRFRLPFSDKVLELRSASTLANPQPWLADWFGGGAAKSGIAVTEQTAVQATAVYACVRVLAETVAALPLHVYRRLPGGGKAKAPASPLYALLHDQPNREMTSFEFREALMGHLCLWGNAYAEIERDQAGRILGLWPLRPDRMRVKREAAGLSYEYDLGTGATVRLRPGSVMHLRGLSGDGIVGYSPIRMAREAIGLALATEEFGARLFSRGAVLSGVVERPATAGKWTEEALRRFRRDFEDAHSGLSQSHRIALLDEGMTWKQTGIPPEDAQYLALRKYQTAEIARVFRVPLHLLDEHDKASTYASVEQFALQFVVHTLLPWLRRWEQALQRDLFAPDEGRDHFAEFLVEGLLRGDTQSRYQAYAVGRQWGWLSADDIREKENMNPLPDGQGQIYLVPLNMTPASALTTEAAPPPQARGLLARAEQPGKARRRRPEQFRPALDAVAVRVVRWEVAELSALVERYLSRQGAMAFVTALGAWADNPATAERIIAYTQPGLRSYAAVIAADLEREIGRQLPGDWASRHAAGYARIFARDHLADSRGQLEALARAATPDVTVPARLDEWRERRPDKIASWESVLAAGVFARYAMRELGVTRMRWAADGPTPCPFCETLNGRVVGIDAPFAVGEVQAPDPPPMRLHRHPRTPPLHEGCVCSIDPEM